MWDNLRALQASLKAEKNPAAEGEEVEPFIVLQAAQSVPVALAPTKARAAHKKATALGWNVEVYRSETQHEPVLFKADGKTGDKGQVRTEGFTAEHFQVKAWRPEYRVGFVATWTVKNGKAGFIDAYVADPYGIPVELHGGYSYVRQDDEYNDNTAYLVHRRLLKTATAFDDWLLDWVNILTPKPKESDSE